MRWREKNTRALLSDNLYAPTRQVWAEELGVHVRGRSLAARVPEGHRREVQEEDRGHRQVG